MTDVTTAQSLAAPIRFLRLPAVIERTGLSRTTIYRLEMEGKFPRRLKTSQSSSAWVESEVQQWAESLLASRSNA